MIHLTYSNRTEALVQRLVDRLAQRRAEGRSFLHPTHIIVPNRNLERFLELELAQRMGVVGNVRFHRLERFVGRWLRREGAGTVMDRRALERHVLAALLDDDWLAGDELGALRRYVLDDVRDTSDVRRAQLALRLARLFEAYAYSRPEMLRSWTSLEGADPERWQRALWLRIRRDATEVPVAEALRRLGGGRAYLPDEVHVFGLSYLARVFQWVFAELGQRTELALYVLNPCREFWEDVPSKGEKWAQRHLAERAPRAELYFDDREMHPHVEPFDDDPPILTWWGRPGREHVHLLNEITGASFESAFVSPEPSSVLRRVQADVLDRAPEPSHPEHDADGSIRALACAGVRREVEVVAEEIWKRIGADPTLRFNEIGVFVHADARALYLPHVTSVFGEAGGLPHHVVDLPLTSHSHVADAALRLLELLSSPFRRPDVLAFLGHPALRVPEGVDRTRWPRIIDRLGVFHGLDRSDHEDTYIERDVVNWDQAVKRLVLGSFLTGDASGDEREFDGFMPEETESDAAGPVLAMLIRSLVRDARFVRTEQRPLGEWARFMGALLRGYLHADGSRQEAEMRRCLTVVHRLAERDASDRPVGFAVAVEIVADALRALGGARGEYLADGVVVSALTPMRAIPFRVVFLLGMGEGRFPTTQRRDPLDLRARKRTVGDVTPVERDKYVFLETLLCARDHFYCSWVSRDSLTGDRIEPSPVVRELLDLLGRSYVRDPSRLVRHFPLRRHDERGPRALIEASRERIAHVTGEALRAQLGRELDGVDLRALADTDEPKARALGGLLTLPRLPTLAFEGTREVTLTLSSLLRFLESPLQGWARGVLGLQRASDDESALREDEPFRPSALDAAIMMRDAFVGGLRERRAPSGLYDEFVHRMQARGRWPLGSLQDQRRGGDARTLSGWQRVFGAVVVPDRSAPSRVRFGSGPDVSESDLVREPITLQVQLDGHRVDVSLTGRTQVLVDDLHASLVLVQKRAPIGVELQRQRAHYALRGFLDHLALTLSDDAPRQHHRTLLLYGDDAAQDASTHFRLVPVAAARAWFEAVVADLLCGPHDYFLPSDAVFRDPTSWGALSGSRLVGHARAVKRLGGGTWRFGPIAAPDRYPIPSPDDALAMAQRRFDLFFRSMGAV